MSYNEKTSPEMAKLAAEILRTKKKDRNNIKFEKIQSIAGCVLAQCPDKKNEDLIKKYAEDIDEVRKAFDKRFCAFLVQNKDSFSENTNAVLLKIHNETLGFFNFLEYKFQKLEAKL